SPRSRWSRPSPRWFTNGRGAAASLISKGQFHKHSTWCCTALTRPGRIREKTPAHERGLQRDEAAAGRRSSRVRSERTYPHPARSELTLARADLSLIRERYKTPSLDSL